MSVQLGGLLAYESVAFLGRRGFRPPGTGGGTAVVAIDARDAAGGRGREGHAREQLHHARRREGDRDVGGPGVEAAEPAPVEVVAAVALTHPDAAGGGGVDGLPRRVVD